jgi:DNA polymerase III alpha subunit (gram-positive type)
LQPFSSFDTATLAGLAYGQTVLAKACQAAGIDFDGREAHSARYDTEKTAELFCGIVNRWKQMGGWEDFDDWSSANKPRAWKNRPHGPVFGLVLIELKFSINPHDVKNPMVLVTHHRYAFESPKHQQSDITC